MSNPLSAFACGSKAAIPPRGDDGWFNTKKSVAEINRDKKKALAKRREDRGTFYENERKSLIYSLPCLFVTSSCNP